MTDFKSMEEANKNNKLMKNIHNQINSLACVTFLNELTAFLPSAVLVELASHFQP